MNHDSTAIDDRRNHDLYRMRDLSGRLLYIGVTNGGLRRFMEHSKDKTWWREVDTINVEHVHCSRQAIEMLEREAIKSERPLYNVAHNNEPLPATTRRRENVRALSHAQQIMAAAERQALNALLPDPVAPVAPVALAPPTPINEAHPSEHAEIVNGLHVGQQDVDDLVEAIRQSPVRDIINTWLAEATDNGCSWSVRRFPRIRPYEITVAAFRLAELHQRNPSEVRPAVASAKGITLIKAWPSTVPVGVELSELTAEQARVAARTATRLCVEWDRAL